MDGVRKGTQEDLPAVLDLLKACVAGMRERGIDQWDDIYPDRARLEQDLDAGNAYVREEDGGLAALAVLDGRQDPEYAPLAWLFPEAGAGIVHRLMVAPAFQGRGLARQVMLAVEMEARARGLESLRLDAFTLNPPALRLYRGLGYREVGLIRLRKGLFQCFEKGLGTAV